MRLVNLINLSKILTHVVYNCKMLVKKMIFQSLIIQIDKIEDNYLDQVIGLVKNFFGIKNIKPSDLDLVEADSSKKSIGIKEVEHVAKWSATKKESVKLLVVKEADKLTAQAQNSLLKVLEEPYENSLIVLVALNPKLLLPTILSRCILKKVKDVTIHDSSDFWQNYFANKGIKKLEMIQSRVESASDIKVLTELLIQYITNQGENAYSNLWLSNVVKLIEVIHEASGKSVSPRLLADALHAGLSKIKS